MSLVTAKEVAKAIHFDKYGFIGTFFGWLLMKLLNISAINNIYNRNKHLKDTSFLNALINDFQIKFEIPEEDLKRLPKNGAYITISNHPPSHVTHACTQHHLLHRPPDTSLEVGTYPIVPMYLCM